MKVAFFIKPASSGILNAFWLFVIIVASISLAISNYEGPGAITISSSEYFSLISFIRSL